MRATTTTKQSIINLGMVTLLALASASCERRAGAKRAGGSDLQPPASEQLKAPSTSLSPATPASANTLRVWRDFSKSTDEASLAKITDDLIDAIKHHHEQIIGIEVVRFAEQNNSVWSEIPEKFIWSTAPKLPEFKPDLSKAPPDAKLFREAKEKFIESERRKYEEKRSLLLSEYKARVEEQLSKFRAYLLQSPTVAAPCTHFMPLAKRMSMENLPYSVLITDGWADCPQERGGAMNGVELHGRHVIIQLTRHIDSEADDEDFLRRHAFLRELFPTSEIVTAPMSRRAIEFIFR